MSSRVFPFQKLTSREGIMALQDPKMRDLYDLKVFVVSWTPEDVSLSPEL